MKQGTSTNVKGTWIPTDDIENPLVGTFYLSSREGSAPSQETELDDGNTGEGHKDILDRREQTLEVQTDTL